ncbi:MAG: anhydro-N-acetylmuramic acid kinase [Alphaproteobacteria bacterium]|nr:anhydro-N-acetylmuramic acid kinase [Alphaproteobacteria bacterium]
MRRKSEAMSEIQLAIGLMSGTSMDGIDAGMLATDGQGRVRPGAGLSRAYDDEFRRRLRAAAGGSLGAGELADLTRDLTLAHAAAVTDLLGAASVRPDDVAVIGFHGHTIDHAPAPGRPGVGRTVQIGDGALLAAETGIDVVADFRAADVAAGGEGAPLAPAYHAALASGLTGERLPLAVLNIGGVANVTWIGSDRELIAFDTGPGNGPIDDFVAARTGAAFDEGGALAAAGTADASLIEAFLRHPYFARPTPKSLDRNAFAEALTGVEALSTQDGAATLTAVVVAAVNAAQALLPSPPVTWAVTGGGRHNATMMASLRAALAALVIPVEDLGWNGDFLEAQAFAYLAVRSLAGLPLSFPGTTGAPHPLTGGRSFAAAQRNIRLGQSKSGC